MAKLTSQLKLKGTIGGLTFYNLKGQEPTFVRTQGDTGVSTEEFISNPVFTTARNHGKEWGQASRFARIVCQIGYPFFKSAKEVSFAGRANKLMFDILEYDTSTTCGDRSVIKGLQTQQGKEAFIGFEGNSSQPLHEVLKVKPKLKNGQVTITLRDPSRRLRWPEQATHAHFATATAVWQPQTGDFITSCSNEIVVLPTEQITIELRPEVDRESLMEYFKETDEIITFDFLFIGFSCLTTKKYKNLHRRHNTATIIACNGITKKTYVPPTPEIKYFLSS